MVSFGYFIVSFTLTFYFPFFNHQKVKDGNILEEVGTGVTSLASKVRMICSF